MNVNNETKGGEIHRKYEETRLYEAISGANNSLESTAALRVLEWANNDPDFCLKSVPSYLNIISGEEGCLLDEGEITHEESIILSMVLHAAAYKKEIIQIAIDLNRKLADVMILEDVKDESEDESDNVTQLDTSGETDEDYDEVANYA